MRWSWRTLRVTFDGCKLPWHGHCEAPSHHPAAFLPLSQPPHQRREQTGVNMGQRLTAHLFLGHCVTNNEEIWKNASLFPY